MQAETSSNLLSIMSVVCLLIGGTTLFPFVLFALNGRNMPKTMTWILCIVFVSAIAMSLHCLAGALEMDKKAQREKTIAKT